MNSSMGAGSSGVQTGGSGDSATTAVTPTLGSQCAAASEECAKARLPKKRFGRWWRTYRARALVRFGLSRVCLERHDPVQSVIAMPSCRRYFSPGALSAAGVDKHPLLPQKPQGVLLKALHTSLALKHSPMWTRRPTQARARNGVDTLECGAHPDDSQTQEGHRTERDTLVRNR